MAPAVVKLRQRRRVFLFLFVLTAASTYRAHGASFAPSAADRVKAPTAEALANGSYACTAAHAALLEGQRRRIADAPTVADARALAVGPVRVARRALAVAHFVAPGSDTLVDAQARLEAFEGQVDRSSSPAEVATRFAQLLEPDAAGEPIQLADLQVENADVHGPGNCHYSTGEIIAIVIGFLLFIIPGIILLIVLC